MCSNTSSHIWLAGVSNAGSVSDQKLVSVLLHETIHAIDNLFLYNALTESLVDVYANSLFQVFKQNDIDIKDSSWFPETVNVLGFDYDVIMSNTFPGSSTHTFFIANDASEIYLSDTDGEVTFSDSYMKLNFITCILYVINCISNLDYDNVEDVTRQLANAVYTVFLENNLEELIKSCA